MTNPATSAAAAPEPIEDSISLLVSALTTGGRVFARALSRISLEGAIDELPTEGPLILAANHASNLDAIVLGSWLTPKLGRRIHWLGKKELFAWPIVGWAAANGGVHPVDRGAADVEAFRLARRILDEGHVLFVFPEGTRSPDGSLQDAGMNSFNHFGLGSIGDWLYDEVDGLAPLEPSYKKQLVAPSTGELGAASSAVKTAAG
jgi:1-acyl-sn-glycerol-3-phosphate acyltransferase